MGKRRGGFTLVELLVSVFILAIGLVAGALCMSLALTCNLRANRVALATEIAQSTIESQRSLGDLTSGTTNLNDVRLPGGRIATLVSDYNTALNLKQLRVTVSWTAARCRQESVVLETIVSKRQKHVGG